MEDGPTIDEQKNE